MNFGAGACIKRLPIVERFPNFLGNSDVVQLSISTATKKAAGSVWIEEGVVNHMLCAKTIS